MGSGMAPSPLKGSLFKGALLTLGLTLAGASTLSAGSAQAVALYKPGTITEWKPGDTYTIGDKLFTIVLNPDLGIKGGATGNNEGVLEFVNPLGNVYAGSVIFPFGYTQPDAGPTGPLKYTVAITDPDMYFDDIVLDSEIFRKNTHVEKLVEWAGGSVLLSSINGGATAPFLFPGGIQFITITDTWGTTYTGTGPRSSLKSFNNNFTQVPAPLPLFGAMAAFGYSRKLRSRIRTAKLQQTFA
jgi:hypothetical protein